MLSPFRPSRPARSTATATVPGPSGVHAICPAGAVRETRRTFLPWAPRSRASPHAHGRIRTRARGARSGSARRRALGAGSDGKSAELLRTLRASSRLPDGMPIALRAGVFLVDSGPYRTSTHEPTDDESTNIDWTIALAGGEGVRLSEYVERRFGRRHPEAVLLPAREPLDARAHARAPEQAHAAVAHAHGDRHAPRRARVPAARGQERSRVPPAGVARHRPRALRRARDDQALDAERDRHDHADRSLRRTVGEVRRAGPRGARRRGAAARHGRHPRRAADRAGSRARLPHRSASSSPRSRRCAGSSASSRSRRVARAQELRATRRAVEHDGDVRHASTRCGSSAARPSRSCSTSSTRSCR